jgi:hypothetical protein
MKLFGQTDDVRRHFTSSRPQAKTDKEDKISIGLSNRSPHKNVVKLNTKMRKNYNVLKRKHYEITTTSCWFILTTTGEKANDFSEKPEGLTIKFAREQHNWITKQ